MQEQILSQDFYTPSEDQEDLLFLIQFMEFVLKFGDPHSSDSNTSTCKESAEFLPHHSDYIKTFILKSHLHLKDNSESIDKLID